jgi:tetratricopeptide (TPR) repeat protein
MLIPILLAAITLAPPMAIKPDITDGEVITRHRTIKVIVQSDAVVTQVELYVGGELRDTATSTPYTFSLDPLTEKDGDEKLNFIAYNTDGAKASKEVMVKIDSGASKGPEANLQIAREFMVQSKWDDAIYSARVALKASPNYVPAELLLSHAFLAKKVFDKAQEFAEDALRTNPNLPEGLELMAAIHLEGAFNSYATPDSTPTNYVNAMADAIDKAIDARQKLLDQRFDKAAASDPIAYAKTAVETMHYSAAVSALGETFKKDPKTDTGNLLGYAQLRLGRFDDLLTTLNLMRIHQLLDGYSYALWALVDEFIGDQKGADDRIKEAILDSSGDTGVQTAQVYMALRRNNLTTMEGLTANLQESAGHNPVVSFYLALLLDRLNRPNEATKAFEDTILEEPLSYQMYIERGNESLMRAMGKSASDPTLAIDRLLARKMYLSALTAKPDSIEGIVALAALNVLEKGVAYAKARIDSAIAANNGYAPTYYVAACVYNLLSFDLQKQADNIKREATTGIDTETQGKIDQKIKESTTAHAMAYDFLSTAKKLDPARLAGAAIPCEQDIFPYVYRYGLLPAITPPPTK